MFWKTEKQRKKFNNAFCWDIELNVKLLGRKDFQIPFRLIKYLLQFLLNIDYQSHLFWLETGINGGRYLQTI